MPKSPQCLSIQKPAMPRVGFYGDNRSITRFLSIKATGEIAGDIDRDCDFSFAIGTTWLAKKMSRFPIIGLCKAKHHLGAISNYHNG